MSGNLKMHEDPVGLLRRSGLLFAINHFILHPLGLALVVDVDGESGAGTISGLWDSTEAPEGIVYSDADLQEGAAKLRRFCEAQVERMMTRLSKLGFIIQPVPGGTSWLTAEVGVGSRAFEAVAEENRKLQKLLKGATDLAVAMGMALTGSTEVDLEKLVETARKVKMERDTFLAEREAARRELEALGSPELALPVPLSRSASIIHRAHHGLASLLDKVARRLTEVHGDLDASRDLLRGVQALETRNLPYLAHLATLEKPNG